MRHDCFRLKKGAECYLVYMSCVTLNMVVSGLKRSGMLPGVHELRDMRHDCFRLKKRAECYLVYMSCVT